MPAGMPLKLVVVTDMKRGEKKHQFGGEIGLGLKMEQLQAAESLDVPRVKAEHPCGAAWPCSVGCSDQAGASPAPLPAVVPEGIP